MQNIEVRPVVESDLRNMPPELGLCREWTRQWYPKGYSVVAEDREIGKIVGYIVPRKIDSEAKTAVFDGEYGCCINVLPKYRNNGLGSILLEREGELLMKCG